MMNRRIAGLALFLAAALGAAQGCNSTGAPEVGAPEEEGDTLRPSAVADFQVVTAAGERYDGDTVRIRIIGPLPDGRPAVAEVDMSAVSPRGSSIGLHLEMDPRELLGDGEWEIELAGDRATRAGLGVLSHGRGHTPRLVRGGHLTGKLSGGRLEASFEAPGDEEASLSFARIGARYRVECLVADGDPAVTGGPTGTPNGGVALKMDEKMVSSFCAPFRDL